MESTGGSRRVRVGVTGHRALSDRPTVERAVDAALDHLGPDAPITVVSSLAEGADRLVAQRVLARPGGRLVAVLPLPADDYARDFADDASRQEFNDLLAAADEVEVIAAPPDADVSREAAYERAGIAVLERSDLLLALWDGAPGRGQGGTAELVAEARQRGASVEVIPVVRAAD